MFNLNQQNVHKPISLSKYYLNKIGVCEGGLNRYEQSAITPLPAGGSGDDWASGGALCDVFAGPFAGARRRAPTRYALPFYSLPAVRNGAPQTLIPRSALPFLLRKYYWSIPFLSYLFWISLSYTIYMYLYITIFAKIIGYMCPPVSIAGSAHDWSSEMFCEFGLLKFPGLEIQWSRVNGLLHIRGFLTAKADGNGLLQHPQGESQCNLGWPQEVVSAACEDMASWQEPNWRRRGRGKVQADNWGLWGKWILPINFPSNVM